MSQNLPNVTCSFGFVFFYVILTISYLRAQTIETSSLPTDSSRPLFKQIEIFSIMTEWLYDCISKLWVFPLIYARVTRVPPWDLVFWAKSLRVQIRKQWGEKDKVIYQRSDVQHWTWLHVSVLVTWLIHCFVLFFFFFSVIYFVFPFLVLCFRFELCVSVLGCDSVSSFFGCQTECHEKNRF